MSIIEAMRLMRGRRARALVQRTYRVASSVAIAVAITGFSTAFVALSVRAADSPTIIPPPPTVCYAGTQEPHESGHVDGVVNTIGYLATPCNEVVSSLAITTKVYYDLGGSWVFVGGGNADCDNCTGANMQDIVPVSCSLFGNGTYEGTTTGTFVYNDKQGGVSPLTRSGVIAGCT
jgi:hypothetical protein